MQAAASCPSRVRRLRRATQGRPRSPRRRLRRPRARRTPHTPAARRGAQTESWGHRRALMPRRSNRGAVPRATAHPTFARRAATCRRVPNEIRSANDRSPPPLLGQEAFLAEAHPVAGFGNRLQPAPTPRTPARRHDVGPLLPALRAAPEPHGAPQASTALRRAVLPTVLPRGARSAPRPVALSPSACAPSLVSPTIPPAPTTPPSARSPAIAPSTVSPRQSSQRDHTLSKDQPAIPGKTPVRQ